MTISALTYANKIRLALDFTLSMCVINLSDGHKNWSTVYNQKNKELWRVHKLGKEQRSKSLSNYL
jgi:hypothetical protein